MADSRVWLISWRVCVAWDEAANAGVAAVMSAADASKVAAQLRSFDILSKRVGERY